MNVKGYLSNQWGFSETGKILVDQVKQKIERIGIQVLDPFEECGKELDFNKLEKLTGFEEKRKYWETFSKKVTFINNRLMMNSHCQFAILDGGPAIDDGVSSEIGYYAALSEYGRLHRRFESTTKEFGKIFALRTDFRLGENIGCLVNPQIEGYIYQTGGNISQNLNDFFKEIESWYKRINN